MPPAKKPAAVSHPPVTLGPLASLALQVVRKVHDARDELALLLEAGRDAVGGRFANEEDIEAFLKAIDDGMIWVDDLATVFDQLDQEEKESRQEAEDIARAIAANPAILDRSPLASAEGIIDRRSLIVPGQGRPTGPTGPAPR